MHLGLESLLKFYREHREDDALVLGTIIATEGSTYRKAGAMMLVAKDGSHRGLISGGCLESDLAQHASQVFETREARIISYDLSAGDDLIWGLGIGCEGVIHLLLQRLEKQDGFGFLSALDNLLQARQAGWFSMVTESSSSAIPIGSFTLKSVDLFVGHPELRKCLPYADPEDSGQRFYLQKIQSTEGDLQLLQLRIVPPPALLICGAGIDTLPVARFATELGWHCVIVDHRAGFADPGRFPTSCVVRQLQPEALAAEIDLTNFDAVIVMSHNLEHDRNYLVSLLNSADSVFRGDYIGLLGPQSRRNRLLREMGLNGANEPTIRGPAGLDIGAELPESIALSIISEIHAVLNQRHGGQLSPVIENQLPKSPGLVC